MYANSLLAVMNSRRSLKDKGLEGFETGSFGLKVIDPHGVVAAHAIDLDLIPIPARDRLRPEVRLRSRTVHLSSCLTPRRGRAFMFSRHPSRKILLSKSRSPRKATLTRRPTGIVRPRKCGSRRRYTCRRRRRKACAEVPISVWTRPFCLVSRARCAVLVASSLSRSPALCIHSSITNVLYVYLHHDHSMYVALFFIQTMPSAESRTG